VITFLVACLLNFHNWITLFATMIQVTPIQKIF
jgi:hypothetical protein